MPQLREYDAGLRIKCLDTRRQSRLWKKNLESVISKESMPRVCCSASRNDIPFTSSSSQNLNSSDQDNLRRQNTSIYGSVLSHKIYELVIYYILYRLRNYFPTLGEERFCFFKFKCASFGAFFYRHHIVTTVSSGFFNWHRRTTLLLAGGGQSRTSLLLFSWVACVV